MTSRPDGTTSARAPEPHGSLNTQTLKTRFGDFEFRNGYAARHTAQRLREMPKG